jgi:hypothetical protein
VKYLGSFDTPEEASDIYQEAYDKQIKRAIIVS